MISSSAIVCTHRKPLLKTIWDKTQFITLCYLENLEI